MTRALLFAVSLLAAAPAAALSQEQAPARPPAQGGQATSGQTKQKPRPQPQTKKPLPSRPLMTPARQPGRPGSFEVSASALWVGPGSLGASDALLTANQAGGPQSFTLFRSSGEFASSLGVQAAVSYNLTRMFGLEGAFTYSPSRIRFTIADDAEQAPGFTSPTQRLSEYFVAGSVLVYPRLLAFSRGRGRTFLSAGAGYMRQLPEERTLVETGQVYHFGGGVKYMLRPRMRGMLRAFGIRGDARLYLRAGGFGFGDGTARSASASAGLVAAF